MFLDPGGVCANLFQFLKFHGFLIIASMRDRRIGMDIFGTIILWYHCLHIGHSNQSLKPRFFPAFHPSVVIFWIYRNMPTLLINKFASIDYNNLIATSVITSLTTFIKRGGQKESKMVPKWVQTGFYDKSVPSRRRAWKIFQIEIKRVVGLKLPWVEFFDSSN